jgi:tRNA threonylcarbamoyladenosine biosynthesis protein TsaB
MKLLALDTSSNACSVALQADGDVVENHVVGAREHTRILVPMIRSLLKEARIAPGDLDAIVLGNGPGSFIGMRIGAAVAQGLAHAAGLDIVPVSSLLAVAEEVFADEQADVVAVAQDARMSEVYLGLYSRAESGMAAELQEECIVGPDHVIRAAEGFVAAGAGWDRYPALAAANSGSIRARSAVALPRSRYLLRAGAAAAAAGKGLRPEQLEPAYLRNRVAREPA